MRPGKIRIGFYMCTLALGGAEQYLRDLLWGLDRTRFELVLFYEPWPPFRSFLGLDGCPQLVVRPVAVMEAVLEVRGMTVVDRRFGGRLRRRLTYYRSLSYNYRLLRRALSEDLCDVLHVSNGGYPAASSARMAALAAGAAGCRRCIMTVANRAMPPQFPTCIENVIDAKVIKATERFIAVSRNTLEALNAHYPRTAAKTDVIYYGTPVLPDNPHNLRRAAARQEHSINPSKRVISIVARLSPEKGHRVLFQALSRLDRRILADTALLVAGAGPSLEGLRELASSWHLEKVVSFLGRLEHDQALQVMAASDVVVLPSEIEGLPYAITEAMSLGIPVIGTNVGGMPEQIVHGETGFLIPMGDADALCGCLTKLLEDSALAKAMGEKGRARHRELFALNSMIARHEDLYEELVSDGSLSRLSAQV